MAGVLDQLTSNTRAEEPGFTITKNGISIVFDLPEIIPTGMPLLATGFNDLITKALAAVAKESKSAQMPSDSAEAVRQNLAMQNAKLDEQKLIYWLSRSFLKLISKHTNIGG